ncbi:hypothetical protein [Duganella sp. Root336D2]|uniref:hypothetical protein n=1 Tax=Duganella sp. Root336D2 TaxID=1736518 RepID=UPI0009E97B55|nr:hypothetical protein [Duganella sp. Root336D2]
MRDPSRTFPQIADPDTVRSAKVWFCKYKSLAPLAELRNLEELVIANFPDECFEFIGRLEKLRFLSVVHMPKVRDFAPLAALTQLTSLSLSTLPSWDASRKTTIIESLDPLSTIPALAHLELFGICPPDKSLVPIEKCKDLRTARISQFPRAEIDRFYAVTKVGNRFNPEPSFS